MLPEHVFSGEWALIRVSASWPPWKGGDYAGHPYNSLEKALDSLGAFNTSIRDESWTNTVEVWTVKKAEANTVIELLRGQQFGCFLTVEHQTTPNTIGEARILGVDIPAYELKGVHDAS